MQMENVEKQDQPTSSTAAAATPEQPHPLVKELTEMHIALDTNDKMEISNEQLLFVMDEKTEKIEFKKPWVDAGQLHNVLRMFSPVGSHRFILRSTSIGSPTGMQDVTSGITSGSHLGSLGGLSFSYKKQALVSFMSGTSNKTRAESEIITTTIATDAIPNNVNHSITEYHDDELGTMILDSEN